MPSLQLLRLILAASLLLLLVPAPVAGFSGGAGGCVSGAASVSGLHIPSTTGDDTLSGSGVEVSVDGTVMDPNTPLAIAAGTEHVITVSATGATPFRGFLLALSTESGIDLSAALLPQDTAIGQAALACSSPLFGVTHTSSADKTSASALFTLEEVTDLVLDVTVVIQNSGGVSQYGYAGYQLTTEAAAEATSAPTSAPAAAATSAPVAASTGAPVAIPASTTAPTTAPAAATTGAPATAVPATPTYGGGGAPTPTWMMSDVPSGVPTMADGGIGGGGGDASDVPSLVPAVDDEASETSAPSSGGDGGEPSGGGSGSSGAGAAGYIVSAFVAGALAVLSLAM